MRRLPFNRVLLYAASCVYGIDRPIYIKEEYVYGEEEALYCKDEDYKDLVDAVENLLRAHGHDVSNYSFAKAYAYNERIDYLSYVQIYD